MEFQELLISSLKRRYKNHAVLQEQFDYMAEKLKRLYKELKEFTSYGLDVEFDENDYSAKLSIKDFYLQFEFFNDDDSPCIQVVWGKEDDSYSFDKIEAQRLIDKSEADRAFDIYLHRTFNDLLKELN
ncbi:MAG: hypothetical protein BAA01_09530 [Bacillus thermozeamaize]|uniref:Uncharacterized protein n=1 Tax=Bacillus thermozeamaize TaxID=230954 RepID=A0A1Y3PN21_9BACI|nr:MAG: hypothetical protein BAA01_09530 [Bacillus thermozeamaize]